MKKTPAHRVVPKGNGSEGFSAPPRPDGENQRKGD